MSDPIVQAVAEALARLHDSPIREAEAVVAAVRSLGVQGVFPDAATLGEGQCCPDVCNGGACETCPSCCAGWCINGHDFTPGVWESMSAEDRRTWLEVASEHSPALTVARPLIEAQTLREAAEGLRRHWFPGSGTFTDPLDSETAYSPDVWLDVHAARIEAAGGAS